MNKAMGMIYDQDKKRFFLVELSYDLIRDEAKIVSITDVGDGRHMADFRAAEFMSNLIGSIDMIKPSKEDLKGDE